MNLFPKSIEDIQIIPIKKSQCFFLYNPIKQKVLVSGRNGSVSWGKNFAYAYEYSWDIPSEVLRFKEGISMLMPEDIGQQKILAKKLGLRFEPSYTIKFKGENRKYR